MIVKKSISKLFKAMSRDEIETRLNWPGAYEFFETLNKNGLKSYFGSDDLGPFIEFEHIRDQEDFEYIIVPLKTSISALVSNEVSSTPIYAGPLDSKMLDAVKQLMMQTKRKRSIIE